MNQNNRKIRTQACRYCYLCNSDGKLLYQDLKEFFNKLAEKWNLSKCQNPKCGLVWLDPMPIEDDILKMYRNEKYITHQAIKKSSKSLLKRLYGFAKEGYIFIKYRYFSKSITWWKKILSLLIFLYPIVQTNIDNRILYLSAQQKGKLLDVGCGNGDWLKAMMELGCQD